MNLKSIAAQSECGNITLRVNYWSSVFPRRGSPSFVRIYGVRIKDAIGREPYQARNYLFLDPSGLVADRFAHDIGA